MSNSVCAVSSNLMKRAIPLRLSNQTLTKPPSILSISSAATIPQNKMSNTLENAKNQTRFAGCRLFADEPSAPGEFPGNTPPEFPSRNPNYQPNFIPPEIPQTPETEIDPGSTAPEFTTIPDPPLPGPDFPFPPTPPPPDDPLPPPGTKRPPPPDILPPNPPPDIVPPTPPHIEPPPTVPPDIQEPGGPFGPVVS